MPATHKTPTAFLPAGLDVTSYDVWLVNTSAGKDSQVALDVVVSLADEIGFPRDRIVAVHCDLGRVEWAGTRDLAERQVARYGLRFEVVKRPQGDLLTQIEQRGKFPSSTCRYCTSDHKRAQVDKLVTQLAREHREAGRRGPCRVLNIMGIRAEESPARRKQEPFLPNAHGTNGRRTVDRWYPIFDWTTAQVWERIRQSGVEHHRAYDLGMPRLSCVFCIYAPRPFLVLAGTHNRELLGDYVRVERLTGHKFRQDCTLESVQAEVEAGGVQGKLPADTAAAGCWNM